MRRAILIIILSAFISNIGISQCPEYLYFYTQSEIDSFPINYPNCTEVEGGIIFYGGTNCDSMYRITSIGGVLQFIQCPMTNLAGFSNLDSIGGNLTVYGSDLQNFAGLENLNYLGGLIVEDNQFLVNLEGLNNLTRIYGYVVIGHWYTGGNPLLVNLNGLNNISSIDGNLEIYHNNILDNITGLEKLNLLGGSLELHWNNALSDISVFDNLTSIKGDLTIAGNNALTSLSGLENISSISGGVHFWATRMSNLDGFNNLKSIDGDLHILSTYIEDLTGIDSLPSIGGDLIITRYNQLSGNELLNNISSFDNLTYVGGIIEISYNNILTSLDGLDNVDAFSVESINITENSLLSSCAVESICSYILETSGTIKVENNFDGCSSLEEVEDDCTEGVSQMHLDELIVYPNPVEDNLFVQNNGNILIKEMMIYNQLGKQILLVDGDTRSIDISHLPDGIYILEITLRESRARKIFIIR